jgi:excisionase family DNA binding protein
MRGCPVSAPQASLVDHAQIAIRVVYTVEEVADLVGVARSTMHERIHAGEIAAMRSGRRVFITAPTVEALIGITLHFPLKSPPEGG